MNPIVSFAISLLINLAIGAVQSMFATVEQEQKAPNLKLDQTSGGDEPISFIIGTYASAGHFNYHGSWGTPGGAPNAYYSEEVSFSDLPISGFIGLISDNEILTLNQTTGLTDKGYPIAEKHDGSRDNFWVRLHYGTQTTADALMLDKFIAHVDLPYTSDMIGLGVAKVIFTARTQRELYTNKPANKMVMNGIPLYDPRLDDTAGGTGSHRWADPSTHAFSDNLVVMIYNICRGIYYNGAFVWGGGFAEWQMPFGPWSTAMGVCDQDIDLDGGGTEKRFRGGAEIKCNEVPTDVINALLASCHGRMCEVGGVFDIVVGPPRAAALSITDEDFEILNNEQTNDLFPGLNQTRNSITGSYIEPLESWTPKQLPEYAPASYLAADDNIPRAGSVTLGHVFSNSQGQRLLKSLLDDDRRFVGHAGALPPEFRVLTPLDTVAWTSEREGYDAKLFETKAMDDSPNGFQAIVMREVDPADHGWTAGTDEQSVEYVPLVRTRPPAHAITAWSVIASAIDDDSGPRRPAILVGWDADIDAVASVSVQVRNASTDELIFERTDIDPSLESVLLSSPAILPDVTYEVRGKYLPVLAGPTEWSSWLSVTTLDLRIDTNDLSARVTDIQDWASTQIREIVEVLIQQGVAISEQDAAQYFGLVTLTDDVTASGLIKFETRASVTEGWARVAIMTRFSSADIFAEAGIYLESHSDGSTRVVLDADQTVITGTLTSVNGKSYWDMNTGAFRSST